MRSWPIRSASKTFTPTRLFPSSAPRRGCTIRQRSAGSAAICRSICSPGSEDPVGQQLRGLRTLIGRYRDAGLRDIAFDSYPGGRHEMLNEINRRQVHARLLGWISRTLEKLNDDDHRVSIAPELQH